MASAKLFCPRCGAKIPSSALSSGEIICPNDTCLHIFTPEEAVKKAKIEKKERGPKKNYLKIYLQNLKNARTERLRKLKRGFLRKVGFLFLAAVGVAFIFLTDYLLSFRGGWSSPFLDFFPQNTSSFLNPYADWLHELLPVGFTKRFPLYYTVFSACGYSLIAAAVSLFFTRYTFYAAVRLMRFLLAEFAVLYVYFVAWPMVPTLGPSFVLEDAVVFIFSHIWPALCVIVLFSLIKPVAAFLCARSNKYALLYKKASARKGGV